MRLGVTIRCAYWLLLGFLYVLSVSGSLACSQPPKISLSYTWPPNALVTVNYNSSAVLGELQTVVTSWNNGLAGISLSSAATSCNPPQFTFGSGTASIHLTVGTIPAQCPASAGNGERAFIR